MGVRSDGDSPLAVRDSHTGVVFKWREVVEEIHDTEGTYRCTQVRSGPVTAKKKTGTLQVVHETRWTEVKREVGCVLEENPPEC